MLAAFHCRFFGKVRPVDDRAVDHMARDSRLVADVLSAHRRLHAVGADQRDAAVTVASRVEDRHAGVVLLDALDLRGGCDLDAVARLRAFEQRSMNVGAVDHRIRIAEAFAEGLARRDAADQRLVERVVHHHLVGVDGLGARDLADAERVERREAVGSELDAGADLAEFGCLLEHLDRESLSHQREGGGDTADAPARDEHPGLCAGCCRHLCLRRVS